MGKGAKDFRRWKACERKRKYFEAEARLTAAKMKQQFYRCRFCGFYHLSSALNTLVAKVSK